MSDTETEDLPVELIVEYIENAVEDLRVTNDYISYATVLDINLENPQRFSDDDKAVLLRALQGVLEENPDIVEEIGWDIPGMLLPFFELEWDYEGAGLKSSDCVKLSMRIFDILAKTGNAKELFIKSIELLSALDYSENDTPKKDYILDLKIYTLLELLSSSMRRINTIYPSKFLAMALSCVLSCFVEYTKYTGRQRFFLRRLYTFARDYIPPLKPLNWLEEHGITQEEAHRLDDDENYLQRTLLQSFVTHISSIGFKERSLGQSIELFAKLKLKEMGKIPIMGNQERDFNTSTREVFSRIVGLAMSFDIDLEDEFAKVKKESVDLIEKAITVVKEKKETLEDDTEDDQLIQGTVGLCLNDYIESSFHPEQKTIPRSPIGLLALFTQYSNDDLTNGSTPTRQSVSLLEALCIHIRLLSPALLSPQFASKGCLDSVLFYDWCAVTKATTEDFKAIPRYVRILFLQSTIHFACTDAEPIFRLILFTLFVRVLTNLEEDDAYEFIVDTLTTAPLESAKAGVLNVLKDFLIRERSSVDDITGALEKTSLNVSDEGSAAPPPLPKRHYIELTPTRADDIYALARECLDETFSGEVIDGPHFKTLLGFLNMLIGIKERFPQDLLSEIVSVTNEKLKLGKKCNDESTNVEFASVALDSLSEFIRQKKQPQK